MKHFITIFLVIIASAFVFLFLIKNGWYPVAIVGPKLIWDSQLNRQVEAALHYYQQALKTYQPEDIPRFDKKQLTKDLRRAAFDGIVERMIVSSQLRKVSEVDPKALVQARINQYLENTNLAEASSALYDLSLEEFYQLVLIPQAERELLAESLGQTFEDWLKKEKEGINIIFFTREL